MEQSTGSIRLIRWILFIPAAAVAAWLAWFAVSLGNKFLFGGQGIEATSFIPRLFLEFASHAAMGAAFIIAGAKLAPAHNTNVAYGLVALVLVAGGFFLFPAFLKADYWSVWSNLAMIVGAGAMAYSINTGELELEKQ